MAQQEPAEKLLVGKHPQSFLQAKGAAAFVSSWEKKIGVPFQIVRALASAFPSVTHPRVFR